MSDPIIIAIIGSATTIITALIGKLVFKSWVMPGLLGLALGIVATIIYLKYPFTKPALTIQNQNISFDRGSSVGMVLEGNRLYDGCGVTFQHAIIVKKFAVSPPYAIQSMDHSNPIKITFPNGAVYFSIQIDTDGHRNRQPVAKAFSVDDKVLDIYKFTRGSDTAVFQNLNAKISYVILGKLSGNSVTASDGYDNLIFKTEARRSCNY